MLPKKKLKPKKENSKGNKITPMKKVASSPSKIGKKGLANYASGRKEIPSARVTLFP